MADVQIRAAGPSAAPLDYVVPGAHEIDITMLSAHFDGTSASVAWLPAIEILSDGGTSCGIIPQDNSVAAGASVEAAWGPFLRSATGGAAPTGNWRFGYNAGTTTTSILSGNTTFLTGDSGGFYTNSTADFVQADYLNVTHHYGIRPRTVGHFLGLTYVSVDPGATFPAVGDNYFVQAALTDGDFEESSFFFGDNRRYADTASNAWPSDILWGELGTFSDPILEFRKPWIISFTNNGAHTITATCATLIVKLDDDTTFLG